MRRVIWIDHFLLTRPNTGLLMKKLVGIALGMHLKVLAVAKIETGRRTRNVAHDHSSGSVDNDNLKGNSSQELAVVRPQRHVEVLRIARIGVANIKQGLVDGTNGPDEVFFKAARQIARVVKRRFLGLRAFDLRVMNGREPDDHDG